MFSEQSHGFSGGLATAKIDGKTNRGGMGALNSRGRFLKGIGLCLFFLVCLPVLTWAAPITVFLSPEQDTMVNQSSPNTSYATFSYLQTRNDSTSTYYSYLKFSLVSIPADAIITGAELYLFVDSKSTGNPNVSILYMSDDSWAENITWNTRPSFDAALASGSVKNVQNWFSWNLLPQWDYGADLVLSDGYLSLGVMTDSNKKYVNFTSENYYHPYLSITYEQPPPIPTPSTVILLGTGLLGLGILRRRRRPL